MKIAIVSARQQVLSVRQRPTISPHQQVFDNAPQQVLSACRDCGSCISKSGVLSFLCLAFLVPSFLSVSGLLVLYIKVFPGSLSSFFGLWFLGLYFQKQFFSSFQGLDVCHKRHINDPCAV